MAKQSPSGRPWKAFLDSQRQTTKLHRYEQYTIRGWREVSIASVRRVLLAAIGDEDKLGEAIENSTVMVNTTLGWVGLG